MAALPPFVSASRPESTWKGAPRLAWPTKLKSTALSVAGASIGAPVCALAMPIPAANDRSTGANPKRAMRLVADARFIEKTPFIRRLERRYTVLLAAIFLWLDQTVL